MAHDDSLVIFQQAAYPVVPQQTMYVSPYTVQSPVGFEFSYILKDK